METKLPLTTMPTSRRRVIALMDLNSCYASIEQAFAPRLRGKPVAVTSNGDGCVVARSPEAKLLGVGMGQPAFELRELVARRGLVLLSSNYALYGDISHRVQTITREFAPHQEVYSIDEQFLDLSDVKDPVAMAHQLRSRLAAWCGLPSAVGIAAGGSKTLAKAANKLAKRCGAGVVDLTDPSTHDAALTQIEVEDVWGIASRWGARLRELGITTALQLRDAPSSLLRSRFGVVMERTQRELQGYACQDLQEVEPDRKQIFCSRSFGAPVTAIEPLASALASHVTRAAERMRERGLRANAMTIFFHTSPFRKGPPFSASRTAAFPVPCDDTRVMLRLARAMVESCWREGFPLVKCGVGLLDLTRTDARQRDLFSDQDDDAEPLMAAVDKINHRFGRGAIRFGVQALAPKSSWEMKQSNLSPRYTTRWEDVIRADVPR